MEGAYLEQGTSIDKVINTHNNVIVLILKKEGYNCLQSCVCF